MIKHVMIFVKSYSCYLFCEGVLLMFRKNEFYSKL